MKGPTLISHEDVERGVDEALAYSPSSKSSGSVAKVVTTSLMDAARKRTHESRQYHAGLVTLGESVDEWILDDLRGLTQRNEELERTISKLYGKLDEARGIMSKVL